MSRPNRIASAISAIAVASALAGCATPKVATNFGGSLDENVGLATRAAAALNANNFATAIEFAERAVEKSPNDAGYRALLGNAYFGAGRFRSAEGAYKDSLSLYSNQPKVILKLALIETALGKNGQAIAFLEAGRSVLDPSDYGLALALAGRPGDAVQVLDAAARQRGADATIRQNLALAHALSGDWTQARTVASQDVPADQLDARIQQWMQLASPKSPGDQVAALVGVKPAASDAGQPVRLALVKGDTMLAQAAPNPAPVQVQQATPVPQPELTYVPAPPPVAPAVPEPRFEQAVVHAPQPQPAPVVEQAAAPAPAPVSVAMMAAAAPEAASAFLAFMPKKKPQARHVAVAPKPRKAAVAQRAPKRGDTVVQLGAYRSPEYLDAAWAKLTQRYPALRAYLPLRARFNSPKGTFWRLSIQGFSNQQEAVARCQLLKSRGGNCFVRPFAGDAPVRLASR
ncbi:MAG TPA: SPOR domain-containing protein [Sphingomicrobium sp.]